MQRTSNIFAKIRAALAAWLFNAVKCNFNNGVSNKERLFTLWGLHEFGHFDTKLFRYKSTRYQLKSFRDIIKVDSKYHESRFNSNQLNFYVLNC